MLLLPIYSFQVKSCFTRHHPSDKNRFISKTKNLLMKDSYEDSNEKIFLKKKEHLLLELIVDGKI